MRPSGSAPPPPPAATAAAGWYGDPAGSGSLRFWDGRRWTDAVSSAVAPASATIARDDARGWALAAHLSAPLGLLVALPPVGPLVVYLTRRDDPFVRRHAAEALNFNISFVLYAIVVVTLALTVVDVGILLLPALLLVGVLWIACVAIAAIRAGSGHDHRYPLTIRFVS